MVGVVDDDNDCHTGSQRPSVVKHVVQYQTTAQDRGSLRQADRVKVSALRTMARTRPLLYRRYTAVLFASQCWHHGPDQHHWPESRSKHGGVVVPGARDRCRRIYPPLGLVVHEKSSRLRHDQRHRAQERRRKPYGPQKPPPPPPPP